jgi:hypothetical protein
LRLFRLAASSFFALALFALSLFALALPAGAEVVDVSTYHGPDFTIACPSGWTVSGSDSGNHVSGSLSVVGPCDRLTMSWTRDPGMDLEEILDQIERSYDGGDVLVLSSERGKIMMKDQSAKTLNLAYEFKGYSSKKFFAVWNSSRSDRLFLASLSGYSGSESVSLALFEELVTSFADLDNRDLAKFGPRPSEGAWPQVLGDFLSSYHYKDARTLPGRTVRVQVKFELSQQNGSYILSSQEELRTDRPGMAAARAGAVAQILQQAGYDARPVQRSGEIAVAVLDPSKKWQRVSVNPASPERMVGVLANCTWEALMYRDFADLAEDNGILEGFELDKLVQKDCEPSRYAELKAPAKTNQSWLDGLQKALESYDYDKYYEENVFDCSNTAQICWSRLQQKGYDARLMMSYKGHLLDPHMWVVVIPPDEPGRFVAVETANTDQNKRLVHLGRMVTDAAYFKGVMYNSSAQFSRLHPEEGMGLAPKN